MRNRVTDRLRSFTRNRRFTVMNLERLDERLLLSCGLVSEPPSTWVVTSTADSAIPQFGQLRYAIDEIDAAPTGTTPEIEIDTAGPVALTQGLLVLSHDATIQGDGDNAATITTTTTTGLLQVTGTDTSVTINNVTFSGTAGTGIDNAGKLMLQGCTVKGFARGLDDSGQVDLFNSKFTDNYGLGDGSGAAVNVVEGSGGRFYAIGCFFDGNGSGKDPLNGEGGPALKFQLTTDDDVAGIENSIVSSNWDGAIVSDASTSSGRFFVDTTSITGNLARTATVDIANGSNLLYGDEIEGNAASSAVAYTANLDGNPASGSALEVQNSSVVNNTVSSDAVSADLGANTSLSFLDATVGGNIGGGVSVAGFGPNGGGMAATVTITSSTIADNYNTSFSGSPTFGGGISADDIAVDLDNTIVAGNTATEGTDIYTNSTLTGNYNLIGKRSGVASFGPDTLVNVNAGLAPLADYGGGIKTYALYSNSLAAGDHGNPDELQTADATGATRTAGNIYIGADNITIPAPSGGTGSTGSGGSGTGGTGTGSTGSGSTGSGSTGSGSSGSGSTGSGSAGGGVVVTNVTLDLRSDRVVAIRKHGEVVTEVEVVVHYHRGIERGSESATHVLRKPLEVRQLLPHHKVVDQILATGTQLTVLFGPGQTGGDEFVKALG